MVHVFMDTIKAPSEGTCIKGLLKSLLVMVRILKDHYLVFYLVLKGNYTVSLWWIMYSRVTIKLPRDGTCTQESL